MLQRMTALQLLYAFEIKEGIKEDYMEMGESKAEVGLQDN